VGKRVILVKRKLIAAKNLSRNARRIRRPVRRPAKNKIYFVSVLFQVYKYFVT